MNPEKPFYAITVQEILDGFGSGASGLTDDQVAEMLERYGPNRIAESQGPSRLRILMHQFQSPLIYLLIIAAIVTAILGHYVDTAVIGAVVVLNALIGYVQEYKAEQSVQALRSLMVPRARVIRNGTEREINSHDLVPGDVVLLTSGDRVPADMRMMYTRELRIDEAMLTGESVPVEKTIHVIDDDNLSPGDQLNIAFMGTSVVSGRGQGVVVATGGSSVLGRIATDVSEMSVTETPLQKKMVRFAHTIGLMVVVSAVAIFAAGLLLGMDVAEVFLASVAVMVSAIPEGLPVVVTITMAIGVTAMARRNAVIRNLPAVETLGSTTVICSDKTGTLTRNEMMVEAVYDGHHTYRLTGSGYDPEGEVLLDQERLNGSMREDLTMTLRIGLLCNEAHLYRENGSWHINGDPTEGALLVSAVKAGLDAEHEHANYPMLDMAPFESQHGFMATLHQTNGHKLVMIKGAPEQVVDMCLCAHPEDKARGEAMLAKAQELAAQGMRVLAMAYRWAPGEMLEVKHSDAAGDLHLVGLQAMIDPPRPEAIDAVRGVKQAGARVIMITGDHALTARAIAQQLGIARENDKVITGRELEVMDDAELYELVKTVPVFARVSPEHKLRIVQQLVAQGEVVAVTGDGVNDAPALKAAHIGVAMGITGTDVAKETADMIVTDDNFASIFNAVEEGRVVFDNIRKVTLFLIPTGLAEILTILATMVAGLPLPFLPAQILWINLVTNGLQDVALAFEPGEPDVLKRPPRPANEGIMSRLMYERTVLVSVVLAAGVTFMFTNAIARGVDVDRARTIAVTGMVVYQFFQAWNARSETQSLLRMNLLSNPFLFYASVATFLAQLAMIYFGPMQFVFRTEALTLQEWISIIPLAATILVAVEIDKLIRRRRRAQTQAESEASATDSAR
jgi:potassium/sodium efflux P-type ATPase